MPTINTPGVNVLTRSTVTPQSPPTATDTVFVVGITQMGRTDQPVLCRSMQDYINNFGQRQSWDTLYDWLDAFFNEAAGGQVYVQRVVGPAAVQDFKTLNDAGAAASIKVLSIGGGASGFTVAVTAGVSAGTYQLVVAGLPDSAGGFTTTLTSPDLTTPQDAVNWGSAQALIRIQAMGANPPAVIAAQALAAGADDRANATDTQKTAALALIPKALGPGQVCVPGSTTEAIYVALLNHAQVNNRFALLSASDTASTATLTGLVATLRADAGVAAGAFQYGMMCADWQIIPGLTAASTRTVAPTAIVAALIARSDRRTGNPNLAAAGANGQVQYALGKTQVDWTDAQTNTLEAAGVMPFRMVFGGERFYGFRTLTNYSSDPVFMMASAVRLRMAIMNEGWIIGQSILMDQIDGQGREAAKYNGMISGRLLSYYQMGALYGATSSDAYIVNTGADVNTPNSIANRELHAAIGIRPSPFAETVFFELAAYAANQPV